LARSEVKQPLQTPAARLPFSHHQQDFEHMAKNESGVPGTASRRHGKTTTT
jgi:hypothetical protein